MNQTKGINKQMPKSQEVSEKKYKMKDTVVSFGKPSVYHAVIVIFLEFFAWGLLTTPMMDVLRNTFQEHTFLINGMIQGIKGILSFLAAPLLGALSDVWGRKTFLLLTVFFTCSPIPLMVVSPWWFFAMISISGCFAVTFSIVFAYVADITDEANRSTAYGLVSATFAASLVTSPAIGQYLSDTYGYGVVVMLATSIAALDVCFILVAVPESLPSPKVGPFTWDQADPFGALKRLGDNNILLLLCLTVFLSYLPEAGQYSCIFVYLRHVIGFSNDEVTAYIAVVGVLSIVAQTAVLTMLFQAVGNRNTILIGLTAQISQLACFAFGKMEWVMWLAGLLAALSSINYPSLNALVSKLSNRDEQGVVQGMVTGIRGLCNGLGPALFGLTFHVFNVEIEMVSLHPVSPSTSSNTSSALHVNENALPGPPFLFGAFAAMLAMLIAFLIPKNFQAIHRGAKDRKRDSQSTVKTNSHYSSQLTSRNASHKLSQNKASDSEEQICMLATDDDDDNML
uniref:Hippocampus abundant transcript 1 protein n=1 Tax=Phallusia mammillata TaxID=59560 RepID=A0A6F9DEF4_9ASCI|nr:hippocampus abundant transcript 1 protein [Phallusia mammillata]